MRRRNLLAASVGMLALPAHAQTAGQPVRFRRVRPGEADWPSPAAWAGLRQRVGGRLIQPQSPFEACRAAPEAAPCQEARRQLRNPWYLGDEPALTQTSGWAG